MRILIVDDDPNIRLTVRVTLELMGHEVDEAASGADAVREVERMACDVVLVDLRLGRESGVDLLNQLRGGRPRLEVVVTTSDPTIEAAVDATRRGALDYLPKPFGLDQLKAALERVTPPGSIARNPAPEDSSIEVGRRISLEELEAEHIRRVVRQCANLEEAAEVLGIDPSTLYRKRKRLGF